MNDERCHARMFPDGTHTVCRSKRLCPKIKSQRKELSTSEFRALCEKYAFKQIETRNKVSNAWVFWAMGPSRMSHWTKNEATQTDVCEDG